MNGSRRELLKKKNVVLVYTGKKVVGGVETERMSIRVGVVQKVPLVQLAKKDLIPKTIKGMETDVFQTEEINALAVDRTARHRSMPGGVSVGHPNVSAGTGTPILFPDHTELLILSNNHVLAHSNDAKLGDQTWQPGKADGGGPADTIGHLSGFVPIRFTGDDDNGCLIPGAIGKALVFFARLLERAIGIRILADPINKVDCAISRPLDDEDVSDEILEIGKPTGYREAKVGDTVKKSGRTTGLTQGNVIATDGVSNVNYGSGKVAIFVDQIIATAMSAGGDSGSVVLKGDNKVVGLLFAGSSSLTIVNKIANVIDALGLQ